MASLQARHSRACAIGKPWTPAPESAAAGRRSGCTCKPTYYGTIRDGAKISRVKAGKNLAAARALLDKINVDVDEGTYEPLLTITFTEWGRQWLRSLERKETTRHNYGSTVKHAADVFGEKAVRRIVPGDVAKLNVHLRDKVKLSDSTRAKHLRVLHACFESAISHHYAKRNPVGRLPASEKPRPQKKEAPYFTNDELPRLFAKLPEFVALDVPNVYRPLFLMALKTGMRQGELLALTWADVDLTEAVVHVRRSITNGHVSAPKNHEKREVHLTGDVVEMLGRWWGLTGKPDQNRLVFATATGGHLHVKQILDRTLYPAMAAKTNPDGSKAEPVPREGPGGGLRTFHSFRHTFAKRALENGRQVTWLSRHLGHSSLKVTTDIYGHWEAAERKREAAAMEGVFGV